LAAHASENTQIRRPDKKHGMVNASLFAAHGLAFPDDVHEILAVEFESVRADDPIR
jgi:hypothetical protein